MAELMTVEEAEAAFSMTMRPAQVEAFGWDVKDKREFKRACLFYKTGAGKTITACLMLRKLGVTEMLVITPPINEEMWTTTAARFGIKATVISHAKFRMKTFKPQQGVAVVADEFHMFGKNNGPGFVKFKRYVDRLRAHALILSATPNYNDAERCYCVMAVIDPLNALGGLLQFISTHCTTSVNAYSVTPIVNGFIHYADAAEFLSKQKFVYYVPDDAEYTIEPVIIPSMTDTLFTKYSMDVSRRRMIASDMERRQRISYLDRVTRNGNLQVVPATKLYKIIGESQSVLIFCQRAEIAKAVHEALDHNTLWTSALLTGTVSKKKKQEVVDAFKAKKFKVLIGTATLATGTDGLDVMCDTMILFDDTTDDALRRQLVGRTLPRADGVVASEKKFYRFTSSE